MQFEIRRVEVIEPVDPEADLPQIASCRVEIGDPGSPEGDIFLATACNRRWAAERSDEPALKDGTILVVQRIDGETIGKEVEKRFLNRDHDSVDELAGPGGAVPATGVGRAGSGVVDAVIRTCRAALRTSGLLRCGYGAVTVVTVPVY